jgi:hypothetical protein
MLTLAARRAQRERALEIAERGVFVGGVVIVVKAP